jgi:hypothetical protein
MFHFTNRDRLVLFQSYRVLCRVSSINMRHAAISVWKQGGRRTRSILHREEVAVDTVVAMYTLERRKPRTKTSMESIFATVGCAAGGRAVCGCQSGRRSAVKFSPRLR